MTISSVQSSSAPIETRGALLRLLLPLTLMRTVINVFRRVPYVVLTPMAALLGVPRATLEVALSLQWGLAGMVGPLSGVLVERYGRMRLMVIGSVMFMSMVFIAALSLWQQWPVVIFLAMLVGGGTCKTLYDPAMQAYIAERTPYRLRGLTLGITEMAWSISILIFGPMTAYFIRQGNLAMAFAIFGILGAISLAVVLRFVPADHTSGHHIGAWPNWSILFNKRTAVMILGASLCISLATELVMISYEAWFINSFTDSVIIVSLASVLSIVTSSAEIGGELLVISMADRLGKKRTAIATALLCGVLSLLLPMMEGRFMPAIALLFGVLFLCEATIVILISLASEALPEARGLMMSSNVTVLAASRAVGTLVGGTLYRTFGFGANGLAVFAMCLITVWIISQYVIDYAHAA